LEPPAENAKTDWLTEDSIENFTRSSIS